MDLDNLQVSQNPAAQLGLFTSTPSICVSKERRVLFFVERIDWLVVLQGEKQKMQM